MKGTVPGSLRRGLLPALGTLGALAGLVACSLGGDGGGPRVQELSLAQGRDGVQMEVGVERTLDLEVRDSAGHLLLEADVVWESDDPSVATVDRRGLIRGVAPGETRISARVGELEEEVGIRVREASVPDSGGPGSGRPAQGGIPDSETPDSGYLVVDADHPAWFRRVGKGPAFFCGPGDPEGFLYRGAREADGRRDGDQMALVDRLRDTGANSIYLQAVRSHGGDGRSDENPFVEGDPSRGLDSRILDQWGEWFSAMDEAGILIFFIFYDDGTSVWDTGKLVGTAERRFVRTLVNRFEGHRNLVWAVAEEYAEALPMERASALAAEIRAADDFGHPVAIHQNSGLTFDFAQDPNFDQFAIQWNPPVDADELHSRLAELFHHSSGRFNLNFAERDGHGLAPPELVRHLNWAAALGGAYVMVYQWDIASTPEEGLRECGHMVRFMESTPFLSMGPAHGLALGETRFVMAGPGEAYIGYTRPGRGRVGVEGVADGRYELRWMDVESGETVTETLSHPAPGSMVLARPVGLGPELAFFLRAIPES